MDSAITKYLAERDALIAQDRSLRRDHARGNYTAAEIQADKLVRALRAEDAATIWSAEHEGVPHPFPGMEFLTGRQIIEKTKLYKLLQKMPKGAILHAHLDATVDVAVLLKIVYNQPAMHVSVPTALDATSLSKTLPEFLPLPESEASKTTSLTGADYVPGTWVQLQKARESFPSDLGGPGGFDKWVTASLTINPSEAYGTHNTVQKIWQKFTSTFLVSKGLIRYAPVWTEYVREFLQTSIADGVVYVEARVNFLYKLMVGADGYENVPHREWLLIVQRVIDEVKGELKSQGREQDFVGMRIIYTTIKFITPEELDWYCDDCIELKKEFPDLIAGFDLVGSENDCMPIVDYVAPLLRMRNKVAELGLDIPFILHAGETLGDGTSADMNLYDAILLDTKRIGHGFSIVKHPKLMDICREKDIMLEVCPISNEVLRLTSSMEMHPLPVMLNHGLPVALSSDDPATWGSTGLSFDFYQVLAASEITGLLQLGEMARDSLTYSTLDDQSKKSALATFEKRWAAFIDEINTSA